MDINRDKEIIQKTMVIAEKFFGTVNDPEQLPITWDSIQKLNNLHPDSFLYEVDENNQPIAWVVVVPTQKELMDKFLKKEINERELFEATQPEKTYQALYLCAAFTLPAYRGQRLATKLFLQAVKKIPVTTDVALFGWPTTTAGTKFCAKLDDVIGRKVLIREGD